MEILGFLIGISYMVFQCTPSFFYFSSLKDDYDPISKWAKAGIPIYSDDAFLITSRTITVTVLVLVLASSLSSCATPGTVFCDAALRVSNLSHWINIMYVFSIPIIVIGLWSGRRFY